MFATPYQFLGGGSTASLGLGQGFRAVRDSGTQAISGSTFTTLEFPTTEFDSESGYASNTYTVPSSLDGKYMVFSAGANAASPGFVVASIYIQVNGTSYLQHVTEDGLAFSVVTGPIQVSTGDTVTVAMFNNGSSTISATSAETNEMTFFAGYVVE